MAQQAKVLFNLAGPYHATGDAVVAACIASGTHYLDLIGETFWMQRLVREQHDAAARAGVKIMPCAGYEALPFDLATLWAAHQLRAHVRRACAQREDRRHASPAGRITDPQRPGQRRHRGHRAANCWRTTTATACATWPACCRRMRPTREAVARRNALQWLPRYDADAAGGAGADPARPLHQPAGGAARRGADGRRRRCSTPTSATTKARTWARLLPRRRAGCRRPQRCALQWAAAASLAAPLANLGATIAGPLQFQREALRALLQRAGAEARQRAERGARWTPSATSSRCSPRGARGARFRGRVDRPGPPRLPLDAGDGGVRGTGPGRRHAGAHAALSASSRRPPGWASRPWRRWPRRA